MAQKKKRNNDRCKTPNTEVATKDFFRGTNILTTDAPKFSRNVEPLFGGSEKSLKFPPNFPLKNNPKFTDELLQVRREKTSPGLATEKGLNLKSRALRELNLRP